MGFFNTNVCEKSYSQSIQSILCDIAVISLCER